MSAADGRMRYRRFLAWSSLAGVIWSTYTRVLAYSIGTALAEFPLASVVISSLVTALMLTLIFIVIRKQRRTAAVPPASKAPAT